MRCDERPVRLSNANAVRRSSLARHAQGGRAFDRARDVAAFNLPARLGQLFESVV
jgi:hypothetical protein